MRRTVSAIMALGALALATPSWPGTLYIPVVDAVNGNGATPATQLWITNPALTPRQATLTFLPENTNGAVRANNPGVNVSVSAKGSMRVSDPGAAGRVGMLEVDFADSSLLQAARLARNLTELGDGRTMVPVVSSANLVPASQTADLVGLVHVDNLLRTDIGIMNLGQAASTCTVLMFRADGTQIGSAATLTFLPLSMRHFPNVLSDQPNLTDARAQVTCNTDFYTYATVHGPDGQLDYFITPALSGSSTLARPGSTTPKGCTAGAVCFDFPGVVHNSTRSAPDRTLTVSPPVAAYKKLKVHLKLTINQFSPPSNNAHGVLYMVRDKNKDMYANVFLKGPGSNQLVLRHGFNQSAGEKAKLTKGFAPSLGQTYDIDYLYDPVAKTIVLTFSLNGQEVTRITDRPNVNMVHIDQGQKIVIGLSNPGNEEAEPASIGWVYRDLHVELIP